MKNFFKTVNYSSCNEDSRSEFRALDVQNDDSILCITGSGARPLELLVQQPAEIVSIDFNPCQNHLLELKMKAFENLKYDELLKFMGITQSDNREHVFNNLRKLLSKEAMNYWDNNLSFIKKGMIYQGRWEKYFKTLAKVIGIERPRIRNHLFNCGNIEEQIQIWEEEWESTFWQLFLRIISPKVIWRFFFGDPGFYEYVPGKSYIYHYIRDKFRSAIHNFLLKDSPFATLLFFGKYTNLGALPIYLRNEHFDTIRRNLSRIQIVTESLHHYLYKMKTKRFSKFSLSDFNSYLTDDEYKNNWERILKSAIEGACICERQWLVKRGIPQPFQDKIKRNTFLEKELELVDDSMFYTFIIAQKA